MSKKSERTKVVPYTRPRGLQQFARYLSEGREPIAAAEAMGKDFQSSIDAMLSHPEMPAALAEALASRLLSHSAPKALKVVQDLLESPSDSVKLGAAKLILDKALIPADKLIKPPEDGDLTGLSQDELHSKIQVLEGELSERATDISAHYDAPTDAKLLSVLD